MRMADDAVEIRILLRCHHHFRVERNDVEALVIFPGRLDNLDGTSLVDDVDRVS
jgi:hypothetical protein